MAPITGAVTMLLGNLATWCSFVVAMITEIDDTPSKIFLPVRLTVRFSAKRHYRIYIATYPDDLGHQYVLYDDL